MLHLNKYLWIRFLVEGVFSTLNFYSGAILVFLPGYDEIMNLKVAITEDVRFQQGRWVATLLFSFSNLKKLIEYSVFYHLLQVAASFVLFDLFSC